MKTKTSSEISIQGVILLALFLFYAVTSSAQTPTLRANGKIAFTSDRDGNPEIYVMNADGTNQTRLTNNSIVDDHAMWSPDGTKLAFVSQREAGGFAIFQMDMDGTNRVEITPLSNFVDEPPWGVIGFSMSWSPDGRKIAFQDPYYDDIYVVDVETHTRQNLTNDGTTGFNCHPAWSPDGSTILYASRFNGICPSLYAINPDGTNRRKWAGNRCPAYSPSWSPDGTQIVFVELNGEFVESELRIANSDGTDVRVFDGGYPDTNNRDYPRWSPDGRKIAFNMCDAHLQDIEIYVKNIDGTGFAQLTNSPGFDGINYRPSWQPLLPTACPNPIDCADFFVRQQYLDFLGREPDPLSADWVSLINNCTPIDPSCDRIHVSEAFFKSPEFQERGYFIWRFYPISFPNVPGVDPPGAGHKPEFDEFMSDLATVSGFLAPTELETAKAQFAVNFTQRPAFVARYGSLNNADFVNTLCSTAGVSLSNQQALLDALNNDSLTRPQVLRRIAESPEVYNRYYNEAFVVMQYFGYLRRNPDALYLDWIDVLNANPADSRHMIEGFVNSIEYRQRFGAENG